MNKTNSTAKFGLLISLLVLASFASASEKVLGRLGQALKAGAIYSSPSSKSRVFYRVKTYEYLIVRETKSTTWIGIVMENGRLGYAPISRIAQLPYQVTAGSVQKSTRGGTGSPSRSGGAAPDSARGEIANYALKYIGTPYQWGGNNLTRGIDCSAFVQQLYGKIGVSLPRTAAEQAKVGKNITRLEELQPGDRLYFWDKKRGKVGHTGIYMGNGYFVHSSTNNKGVNTDYLGQKRWRETLVYARRDV